MVFSARDDMNGQEAFVRALFDDWGAGRIEFHVLCLELEGVDLPQKEDVTEKQSRPPL